MGRESNRLTALKIAKLAKPGLYADGGGLCLQVQPGPSKAWVFRYMLAGRARKMGLGPAALLSLAEARDKALACRKLLLDRIDPIEARRHERAATALEALRAITFGECADRYVAAHRASWKNAKHAAQWSSTLETYVKPIIGSLAVQSVDTAAVLKVLEQPTLDRSKKSQPLWMARPDTAGRVRGRIELILDWAAARTYRSTDNPARWRGHIDKLMPSRAKIAKVKHHPALAYTALPEFMPLLRAREGNAARALEFTILTAARTNEVTGAKRSEFDLVGKMWTIAGERMKSGRPHRVPLSDRALAIIAALPSEGEFVFPGRFVGTPLSNMAMLNTLQVQMGRDDITVHGFRSTFHDWGSELTAYANEMLEMALAHVVDDKVEAAYRRGDLFEKRRRLMADWADYCASDTNLEAAIIPIRQPAA